MKHQWDFVRPIFVAYEPWETQLASAFLESLSENSTDSDPMLLVADPYQVRNRRSAKRLKRLSQSVARMEVLFDALPEWEVEIHRADVETTQKRWESMAEDFPPQRLDLCLKSDVHLFPRERTPYYYPTKTHEKKRAALLVFERILRVFDEFRPDVILMIGDQYLAKNFIGLLAERHNIPIRIIRPARFQDFYKCDDFFLPQVSDESDFTSEPRRDGQVDGASFGEHLYLGNRAVEDNRWLRECRQKPLSWTVKVVAQGAREQLEKFRTGLSSRPREFRHLKYWVSSPSRVRLHNMGKTMRKLRFVWGQLPFVDLARIPDRYFLVPLHYRPESSTLTQGFGIEDENLVHRVADLLEKIDPGISCVVLENPSMIELRKLAFYRDLTRRRNVMLADPRIDTQQLVRKALGVLTITGTVALEASLHDVPVHVVGRPDYLEAMRSHGMQNLEPFLEASAMGTEKTSSAAVKGYLEHIRSDGHRGHLGWGSLQSSERRAQALELITNLFRLKL